MMASPAEQLPSQWVKYCAATFDHGLGIVLTGKLLRMHFIPQQHQLGVSTSSQRCVMGQTLSAS
jgi:hypothetical protein